MSTLDANIQRSDDGTLHVFLSGTIDEESDFEGIFSRLDAATLFNFEGIKRLNSIGVHRWIDAISTFSKEQKVTIEDCSYVVALQANCVANLFGEATISSCFAPYFCPTCKSNSNLVVTAEDVAAADGVPPAKKCETCQSTMAFDELDNYFDFLAPRKS